MPNDQFDFPNWNKRWDDDFIAANRPLDTDYVSPYEAIVRERRVTKLQRLHPELKIVPADYFVFGLGEPANRATTKIAGVPYLPLGIEWPHDGLGNPLQFFAQVNFSDSQDIVGAIPQDILLVFAGPEPSLAEDFSFVWVADDPTQPLILPASAREFAFQFAEAYGEDETIRQPLFAQIFRTKEIELDETPQRMNETNDHLCSGAVCASCIGGIDRIKNPSQLFRLETVGVHANRAHPWLNRERAYTPEELDGYFKTFLTLGDMGSLRILLTDDGQLSVDFFSY